MNADTEFLLEKARENIDLDPKYHQYLIKAQELRQTSDYGHHETVTSESVKQVLAWAREFLSTAKKHIR